MEQILAMFNQNLKDFLQDYSLPEQVTSVSPVNEITRSLADFAKGYDLRASEMVNKIMKNDSLSVDMDLLKSEMEQSAKEIFASFVKEQMASVS